MEGLDHCARGKNNHLNISNIFIYLFILIFIFRAMAHSIVLVFVVFHFLATLLVPIMPLSKHLHT